MVDLLIGSPLLIELLVVYGWVYLFMCRIYLDDSYRFVHLWNKEGHRSPQLWVVDITVVCRIEDGMMGGRPLRVTRPLTYFYSIYRSLQVGGSSVRSEGTAWVFNPGAYASTWHEPNLHDYELELRNSEPNLTYMNIKLNLGVTTTKMGCVTASVVHSRQFTTNI